MINRDNYLNQLIRKKENGLVKVITGLRRSGKSFLLFTIYRNYLIANGIKKNHIIFNKNCVFAFNILKITL